MTKRLAVRRSCLGTLSLRYQLPITDSHRPMTSNYPQLKTDKNGVWAA